MSLFLFLLRLQNVIELVIDCTAAVVLVCVQVFAFVSSLFVSALGRVCASVSVKLIASVSNVQIVLVVVVVVVVVVAVVVIYTHYCC